MRNAYHFTRTILIPKRHPNRIVLTVGSDGNVDIPSFQINNGRASIKVFEIDKLPANGVVFNKCVLTTCSCSHPNNAGNLVQYSIWRGSWVCAYFATCPCSWTKADIIAGTDFVTMWVSRRIAVDKSIVLVRCATLHRVLATADSGSTENSLDNAMRLGRDVHTDNPAEKVYRCASVAPFLFYQRT